VERLHTLAFRPQGATVRVPVGITVFEAASWAGVTVDSTCGGRGTCGKCRVRVLGAGAPTTEVDRRKLSPDELEAGWRLACRSTLGRTPVSLEIEVPPMRTTPKAALLGRGRHIVLAPSAQRHHIRLDEPALVDQRADLDRIRDALPDFELRVAPNVLYGLPAALRAADFDVTAAVVGDRLVAVEPGDTSAECLGLAVDVGTTTVSAALVDLANGAVVALGSAMNEQARFGADVISRITHAMESRSGGADLRAAVLRSVNALLGELLASAGVGAGRVIHTVVVGNSTMLHLLLGVDAAALAVAPFVPAFAEPLDLPARDVGIAVHPDARIETFPLVGAYIGADIVAGVLATGIARDDRVSLLIDIGTNGEIVLATPTRVFGAAAPAGPAFEGAEIRNGMRATDGAIEAVRIGDGVDLDVVGGGKARGICGSGLADTVAGLLEAGVLDRSGRLLTREEARMSPLADRLVEVDGVPAFRLTEDVAVTQHDLRALQYAKGAIAAGIEIVLRAAGLGAHEIDEVLLAGSFGTYVDPASARAIGLVPHVDLGRVTAVGNSALEGAKIALLSFREQQLGFGLAERIDYVELSSCPEFDAVFVDALAFPDPETTA